MTTATETMERNGIQAMRAVACLLVLVQHVTYFACQARGIAYQPFLPIDFGVAGVALFFVISGYVMGKCLGEGPAFILHRAARIYPPFWLAIVISAVMLGGMGQDWHFDWWSALLLPTTSPNNTYMIPYWTLCYEAAFYVATYALIIFKVPRRSIPGISVAWIAAVLIFDAYRTGGMFPELNVPLFNGQPGWLILLSPVTVLFPTGLLLSTLPRRLPVSFPTSVLVLAALCLWSLAGHVAEVPALRFLIQGIAFSGLLIAAQRTPFPRFAARLGDYSYGVYLVHVVAITVVFKAIPHGTDGPRFIALWAIMFIASALSGAAFGWFEYQFHTRVVRRFFRPRPHAAPASALAAAPPSSAIRR